MMDQTSKTVNAASGTKKLALRYTDNGIEVALYDSNVLLASIIVGAQDLENAVNDLLWWDGEYDGPEEPSGNLAYVEVRVPIS